MLRKNYFTDNSVCLSFDDSMRKPNAKDRILETAGALFFQRGYSGVGINEIIEKAGTAKASFYQYYPSKESLCEAWLRALHDQSENYRRVLLEEPGPSREKVARYFDRLGKFLVESDFRGCPYSNTGALSEANCPGIAEQIREHKEATRNFFRILASRSIDEHAKADETGDRIFVLYSGATAESQNLKELWPVTVARSAAVDLLPI